MAKLKALSEKDLNAFTQMRGAIEASKLNYHMLCAGYNTWADDLRNRYELKGPFDVDLKTGQINEAEETDG